VLTGKARGWRDGRARALEIVTGERQCTVMIIKVYYTYNNDIVYRKIMELRR